MLRLWRLRDAEHVGRRYYLALLRLQIEACLHLLRSSFWNVIRKSSSSDSHMYINTHIVPTGTHKPQRTENIRAFSNLCTTYVPYLSLKRIFHLFSIFIGVFDSFKLRDEPNIICGGRHPSRWGTRNEADHRSSASPIVSKFIFVEKSLFWSEIGDSLS